MTPAEIRKKTFTLVRRGFDPQEVGPFLENVATELAQTQTVLQQATARLESVETELATARSAEEALKLTMVHAAQAKEEMITTAQRNADSMRREANEEAHTVRSKAREEADRLLTDARSEALRLLEESRRDAEVLVAAARDEQHRLRSQVSGLRAAIHHARGALEQITSATLGGLDELGATLDRVDEREPQAHEAPASVDDARITELRAYNR